MSETPSMSKQATSGHRALRKGTVWVMLIGILLMASASAAAALPDPIDGAQGYPPELPAGCEVDGAAVINGESFSHAGQTSNTMRSLTPAPGETLTMTWDSFAPGCEGIGISLSAKSSSVPFFDPSEDQLLLPGYDYCGPAGPACPENGPYQLSIVVPAPASAPCFQLDAAIGPPLAVVGPSGSFYGLNQSQNMLISALNAGTEPCEIPPVVPPCPTNPDLPADSPDCIETPPCPTNPDLPADSPDCVETPPPTVAGTVVTSPSTTSTTLAPATTLAPTTTRATTTSQPAPATVTTAPPTSPTTGVPPSVLGQTTIAGALAQTGSDTQGPGLVGIGLVLSGLGLLTVLGARSRRSR